MKSLVPRLAILSMAFPAFRSAAATLYVDLNSTNPVPPYAGWSTAATSIQDAVDAASDGDEVLVTNGVYRTGGRIVYGSLTNRVAINKAVNVESVNGPAMTIIEGYQVPGAINGDSAVRCAYLTNNALLVGFALTNGACRQSGNSLQEQCGGGVWCESSSTAISNCVLSGNYAQQHGGGAFRGLLFNCTLTNNTASYGGGTASNTLFNCTLTRNSSTFQYGNAGGGAYGCTLSNSLIIGNQAIGGGGAGGGAALSTLYSCIVTNNAAGAYGGGMYSGVAYDSFISGNRTPGQGGGARFGTYNDCVFAANCANDGGGAVQSTLTNCTLTGNWGTNYGGGVDSCFVYNCSLSNNFSGTALGEGGGALYSFLSSSVISRNSAATGAGACSCTAVNCIISGNTAVTGGGAAYGTLDDCILTNNSATGGGGGVFAGTLDGCLIVCNISGTYGGGSYGSTLNNCTVVSNSATAGGGGIFSATATNSILFYNIAPSETNFSDDQFFGSTLNYCCTAPLPTNGVGNITSDPVFVDLPASNFHLQSNSPCINSGNKAYVNTTNDLDGNPRIAGGTVDIGAYEYQTPTSVLSYAWAQQYTLPTDGSADYADSDGDGVNNYQEWIAGTNPTNALSLLEMLNPTPTNNPAGLIVSWQSVSGVTYFLQSSTNLGMRPAFSTIQSNIVGQVGTTSYTDTTATNGGPYLYRVGVQ